MAFGRGGGEVMQDRGHLGVMVAVLGARRQATNDGNQRRQPTTATNNVPHSIPQNEVFQVHVRRSRVYALKRKHAHPIVAGILFQIIMSS
jgi:hypothetical protein